MPPAPYRAGLTSQTQELRIPELPVEGTVPDWLRGTLIRNGPARFEVGKRSYNHWFDGLAMLHAFTLGEGSVGYANRFLETGARREAQEAGRIRRSEFGTDPCYSLFGRVMAVFRPPVTDNANINVVKLGDTFAALTETPLPIRFDPETLETLGVVEFEDDLKGTITTAHPHRDPSTGTLYSYLTHFSRKSSYHLYRLEPGRSNRERIASIEVDRPAYMHSFAMTGRHLILAEFPLVVNPTELLTSGVPFIRNYRWEPERGTRFQVWDRATGEHLASCTGPALFAFHHINAFVGGTRERASAVRAGPPNTEPEGVETNSRREKGEVVLDLAGYEDASIIDALYLDPLRSGQPEMPLATPWRLRLDLDRETVSREVLSDQNIELPRVNERRVSGRPYRYVWGTGNRVPGHFTDELVKIDVRTGVVRSWYAEGCFPGEPVFVGRPDAPPGPEGEDHGVLLSVVLDARSESSFLLILDAATLEEEARATVPHALPLGFHGQYYGQDGAGSK